jgi:hypothetical protein
MEHLLSVLIPTSPNFGVEFGMRLVVFILLGKWYAKAVFEQATLQPGAPDTAISFLLRYLALMSLARHRRSGVTQSTFALYQAYGDFIAFLLALTAFTMVRFRQNERSLRSRPLTYLGRSIFSTRWFAGASSAREESWKRSGTSSSFTCLSGW